MAGGIPGDRSNDGARGHGWVLLGAIAVLVNLDHSPPMGWSGVGLVRLPGHPQGTLLTALGHPQGMPLPRLEHPQAVPLLALGHPQGMPLPLNLL